MLVKELQSLGLNIRTLDKDGNDIQLSTLGNDDDEPSPYSGRADLALIDDITDNSVETDDIADSFLIDEVAEDDIPYEEEEVFEGFGDMDDDNM